MKPKWSASRVLVPVACVVIIVWRAIRPELRFDQVSLWLFAIGAVVLLIPDIGNLLHRIRRIKRGDTEIEFEDQLAGLKEKAEKAEGALLRPIDVSSGYYALPQDITDRVSASLSSPRGALLTLALEIESQLKKMQQQYGLKTTGGHFSPRTTIQELEAQQIVERGTSGLFEDFWRMRNRAVHDHGFHVDDARLYELVELGVKLLRFLLAAREPDSVE